MTQAARMASACRHRLFAWSRPWPSALLLATLTIAVQPAHAGGLRDLEDAWLVGPQMMLEMLETRAGQRNWQVTLGHGRLYGLPELPQSALSLQRRWATTTANASWQRLGGELYREQQWRLLLTHGNDWRLGARAGIATLDLAGGPPRSQTELDVIVQAPLTATVLLEAWLPLGPAPVWYGQHGLRRWLLVSGAGDAWVWAAAVDRAVDGTPSLQGELLLKLAPNGALGLRLEPATGTVGLTTAWRKGAVLLRTSHALHPELGPTHRWGLVVERNQ